MAARVLIAHILNHASTAITRVGVGFYNDESSLWNLIKSKSIKLNITVEMGQRGRFDCPRELIMTVTMLHT